MSSDPLLGSAYLRSQSPLPPLLPTPPSESLCLNLSLFKSHLKSLRALDDSIILRLNRSDALSRSSDATRPNRENTGVGKGECDAFWAELVEGWNVRGDVLKGCLEVVDKGVKKEFYGVEKGLDRDRTVLGRGESSLEVKRRQMHQELAIERIIRQRSITFFQSRCPSHPLLPAAPELTIDTPVEQKRGSRAGRDSQGNVRWNG